MVCTFVDVRPWASRQVRPAFRLAQIAACSGFLIRERLALLSTPSRSQVVPCSPFCRSRHRDGDDSLAFSQCLRAFVQVILVLRLKLSREMHESLLPSVLTAGNPSMMLLDVPSSADHTGSERIIVSHHDQFHLECHESRFPPCHSRYRVMLEDGVSVG